MKVMVTVAIAAILFTGCATSSNPNVKYGTQQTGRVLSGNDIGGLYLAKFETVSGVQVIIKDSNTGSIR